jgi:hypothetical protein
MAKIMERPRAKDLNLEFHPVTSNRWPDFEALFGENGACGGCWCMLWRLTRKEFEQQKGKTADVFAWTGLASFFRKAGFVECARRSQTRPVMRYFN